MWFQIKAETNKGQFLMQYNTASTFVQEWVPGTFNLKFQENEGQNLFSSIIISSLAGNKT